MTNEEAIKILENEKACVNRANKNDYCNRDCYNCELVKTDTEILNALDMAIQAIEQTKWISVSEKLPGSDEDVLLTNGIGMYIGWIDPTDGAWRVDSESEYFMRDIIAWMPLPIQCQPKEGERSNKNANT